MTNTTKIRDAIRTLLQRNLEILIGESCGTMDVQDDDGKIKPMGAVTTRDVRGMLNAVSGDMAMMFHVTMEEAIEKALVDALGGTVRSLDSVIDKAHREWDPYGGGDSDEWSLHLAQVAYAEGAKAERLTLSKEWQLARVADDVREACACMVDTLADREASQLATRKLSATPEDALRYAASIIRETPVVPK